MEVIKIPNNLVEKAITFATEKHTGQTRWNGEPYILHPIRVMTRMQTNHGRVVAVLHDVLEDTDATEVELKMIGFPMDVCHTIRRLSKTPNQDYAEFINGTLLDPVAIAVKIADLNDNLDIWNLQDKDGVFVSERHRQRINKYLSALRTLHGHFPQQFVV